MTTLPDNWLEIAASHGATKWVKQFIQTYLPQLTNQQISAQQFALHFADELVSRSLTTPAQQKNYRSNLCQAVKTINPSHPAIALISPTAEEYRKLNDAQRGKLADRETRYFTSDQAQDLVDRATGLLNSAEWSDVGAGLSVLVGRRISEILLSEFSLKSPWSLTFNEIAKKKDTEGLTIEIPTLAPAKTVLGAIQRLQKGLKIEDLKLNSLSPKLAKQAVNQRYSDSVAAKCVEHFSSLVPTRSDRENLYTHIFRAVYATIAAHWFCPANVPEHNFKAEIQGHFTLTSDGKKLPNYSARANYDDYAIGTTDGNRDGRLGIKLGMLPELQVIEAFRPAPSMPQTHAISQTALTPLPTVEVVPIDYTLPALALQLPQHPTPHPLHPPLAQTAPPPDSSPHLDENHTMSNLTPKPKTRRPELFLDDLERMSRLMAQQGVTGSAAQLFHALLDTFQALQSKAQQQQIHSMGELSASLNWFTHRIDTLETTCQQLQAQRDQLLSAQPNADHLQQLRAENAHLKQQLQHTQARLHSIQQLLGTAAHSDVPLTAPASELNASTSSLPAAALTPVAAPATTPPAAPSLPQSPTTRRNRADTTDKLNQIIDALISWNTAQPSSDTQLRISFPTIKGLASPMGANYQPVIQEVLKHRADELEEHHRRLLIGTRHNAGVVRKDALLQSIARDYLGLDNWNEVKYAG